MHMMLHICDQFSEDFDINFNWAVRVGNRYSGPCDLQLAGKDIIYVSELMGVQVLAARSCVEHLRLKFYRTFNCIYAKSKAANCEMVTGELLKSYYLLFMLYAAEAVCYSSANSCIWQLHKQSTVLCVDWIIVILWLNKILLQGNIQNFRCMWQQ